MADAANESGTEDAGLQEPVIPNEIQPEGEFDSERALRTIEAQRASEEKLKKELAKYRKKEKSDEDANKTALDLLSDRDAEILTLKRNAAIRIARSEFKAEAAEAGITDTELALLVAERDGLFGEYDSVSESIETTKVDFDVLVRAHPALASKTWNQGGSSDAGRVQGKKPGTVADAFSRSVRGLE